MDEEAPAGHNDGTWDDPVALIEDLRDDIEVIRDRLDELAGTHDTVGIREAEGCLTGALVLLHEAQERLT